MLSACWDLDIQLLLILALNLGVLKLSQALACPHTDLHQQQTLIEMGPEKCVASPSRQDDTCLSILVLH